ncbi:MAG: hypothetical protein A3F92_00355 [Candidatus Rokubacteria bacterium RIFCSPLOWO2_12_FULL_71_22]|nr:MAG: hypothetical protein A3F92_00355 [Candidatus Rokubacteria bacterium RIFCSPLOWO2_12_FULL_71_22]
MALLRTIVEGRRFTRELARIKTNPHAADELIDAVKWTLARDPRAGVQVAPRNPVWFIAIDEAEDNRIGVYYAFSDDEIFLISIRQE